MVMSVMEIILIITTINENEKFNINIQKSKKHRREKVERFQPACSGELIYTGKYTPHPASFHFFFLSLLFPRW